MFRYIIFMVLLIIIDQKSKKIAEYNLMKEKPKLIYKRLYLVLVYNKGAAFGFMKKNPKVLKFLTIVLVTILICYFFYIISHGYSEILKFSLALILSGGISNAIDRIVRGYVIDFIFFKYRKAPIFNFADTFIVLGVIIFLVG